MAGIGSFDQTGSLSDAFKRGALTYGGGQAARYIGGAGFQGNPFEARWCIYYLQVLHRGF